MRIPGELLEHIGYEVVRELRAAKLIETAQVEHAEATVTAAVKRNLAVEAEIEAEAKRLLDANRAQLAALGGDYFVALQKFKAQVARQRKFAL